ncbi:MAG: type III pantothenate kinase, partial [bacterium]|nr:type III pantothenate kinase [bacterium]
MFLGIDIGNTNTIAGIYKNESIVPGKSIRYKTRKDSSIEELGYFLKGFITDNSLQSERKNFEGIAFSSVVPELNQFYNEVSEKFFGLKALEIDYRCNLLITLNYDNLSSLGVDRIVNAEAAFTEYK